MTLEQYILSRLNPDLQRMVQVVNTDLMIGPVYGLAGDDILFWADDRIGTPEAKPWDYSKALSLITDAVSDTHDMDGEAFEAVRWLNSERSIEGYRWDFGTDVFGLVPNA